MTQFWRAASARALVPNGRDKLGCYDGYRGFLLAVIELPDEQAAALKAKAAAGLTLEEWLQKLAEQARPPKRPRQHIADVIVESMSDVPPDIMAAMPKDGASQHDHYIYGWPKREA